MQLPFARTFGFLVLVTIAPVTKADTFRRIYELYEL